MSTWVITLLVTTSLPVLIGIAIALFGKFCPKEKTYSDKIKPTVIKLAKLLDDFLDLKVGKSNADKIEENFICTVCYWFDNAVRDFYAALIEDNKEDKK